MKILVIQQKRVGDVVVSSALCNNLRKHLPDAEIHYQIFSFTKDVAFGNPNIDELILFEDSDREPVNLLRFALRIRRSAYDVVIDAYSKMESRLITMLSGANERISFRSHFGIYNVVVPVQVYPPDSCGMALADRLNLLKPILGEDVYLDPQHRMFLSQDEIEQGRRLLEAQGVDPQEPIAVFGIFGSLVEKSYPEDYMQSLLAWFQDQYDMQIMLNYFPEQSADARRFYESMKNKTSVFPEFGNHSLRDLARMLSFATLYIGNDSGHPHIAKSMSVPTFTLFAPFVSRYSWGVLDELDMHDSADIGDLLPDETKHLHWKQIRVDNPRWYRRMIPELIIGRMENWLRQFETAKRDG